MKVRECINLKIYLTNIEYSHAWRFATFTELNSGVQFIVGLTSVGLVLVLLFLLAALLFRKRSQFWWKTKQTKNTKNHDFSHWQTIKYRLVNWPENKLIILSTLRFSGNLFLQNPRDHLNLIGIWPSFWHFNFYPWRYFKTEPSTEKREDSDYSIL